MNSNGIKIIYESRYVFIYTEKITINKSHLIQIFQGIHPGLVNTEIYGDSVIFNKLKTKLPVVEPKDVVDCVIFALSAPPNVQV